MFTVSNMSSETTPNFCTPSRDKRYDGFQKPLTYTFGNAYLKLCVCVAFFWKFSGSFPEDFPEAAFSGSVPEVFRKLSRKPHFRYASAQGILKLSYIYIYNRRRRFAHHPSTRRFEHNRAHQHNRVPIRGCRAKIRRRASRVFA